MIIAVDFDGILCRNRFPDIGRQNEQMVRFVKELIECKHEVILWTSRVGKPLEDAVRWCEGRGLHFCAINENAPSNRAAYEAKYPDGTRKIYADIYIDDHNPYYQYVASRNGHDAALSDTIECIMEVLKWKTK